MRRSYEPAIVKAVAFRVWVAGVRHLIRLALTVALLTAGTAPSRAHWCGDCEYIIPHIFHHHHPLVASPANHGFSDNFSAHGLSGFGGFAAGAVGAAAVAPMIATIVLGRELTVAEFWRLEMSMFLGPAGWYLADRMFPPRHGGAPGQPPSQGGSNINHPPRGEIHFVPNEVLIVFAPGTPPAYIARLAARLGLTVLDTQSFGLTGITVVRFGITNGRSLASILRALARYARIVAAQPNYLYLLQQGAPMLAREAGSDGAAAQYVVDKLHLRQAHQISDGDNVGVAVIDSQIDRAQPELTGSIAADFDAVGGQPTPHPHGTAIAGAIAAHAMLIGVAPKVKLYAARVFTGSGDSAQGTTFNILKGLDWAASENVRVVNMSFAGPADPLMRITLRKAYAHGTVLVAAVGNAGPRARPLYPAAYPEVIGVTATDADNKTMAQANRGQQVTVAAPGVDVIEPAPNDRYQITSGTSVAAAHVSGVAALLLARDPALKPDAVKRILTRSAQALHRPAREVGAGEIDALAALKALAR